MSAEDDLAFEKILSYVGDDGVYQKRMLWFFGVPLFLLIPWTCLVPIFQASVPDHWCYVPGRPENVTIEQWKNLTIPWIEKDSIEQYAKCLQFSQDPQQYTNDTQRKSCENGWEYDKTYYDNTLPMQMDWVCEKDYYTAWWLSAAVAGNVVGTLLFSIMSDYCGRKPAMVLMPQMYAIVSIIKLYVTSEWGVTIMMFLSAMIFPPILEISLIIILEQVSSKMRASITSMSFNMWTLGMSLLPFVAWLCRDWVTFGIVTSVPFFPFIGLIWLLSESPRWTMSVGKIDKTTEILERIARINGVQPPKDLYSAIQEYSMLQKNNPKMSKLSFLELFSLPTIRIRTILLTLTYLCNNLVYYALIYNISNMSGNEFINFFLISITELPANLVAWYFAQKIGRRWTGTGFFVLCTLCAAVTAIIPVTWGNAMTAILIICKAVINGSFLVVYLQLAEIYPTSHRASGTGFSSTVSSIVSISGPSIAYSSAYWFKLPYVIIFLLCVCGSVITSFLPETLGAELPQNIADANDHLKGQKYFSYLGKLGRRKKISHKNNSLT